MQQYALTWQMSGQRGPRRDGPTEDGFVGPSSPILSSSLTDSPQVAPRPVLSPRSSVVPLYQGPPTRPTFGVDLGEQMHRDGLEVPRVLEKCCQAIELHGLELMGIYRLSGTTSRVQRLKANLDRGGSVRARGEEG